jgi:hypothetical protein
VNVLLALAIAALSADREPGQLFDAPQRRRMVAEYAACVVKILPKATTRIALQEGSPIHIERDFERTRLSGCVPGTDLMMSMSRLILQFAFANALIRGQHVTLPQDLSAIKPLNQGPSGPAIAKAVLDKGKRATDSEKREALRAAAAAELSRFGECVVRASPQGAQALLQTDVAGPAEASMFAALSASFGTCLDKGQKVTLTKDVVRGAVALNYFRLASEGHALQQGLGN